MHEWRVFTREKQLASCWRQEMGSGFIYRQLKTYLQVSPSTKKTTWQLLWCVMNFRVSQWINSPEMSFTATSDPLGAIQMSFNDRWDRGILNSLSIAVTCFKTQAEQVHLKEYVMPWSNLHLFVLLCLRDHIKANQKLNWVRTFLRKKKKRKKEEVQKRQFLAYEIKFESGSDLCW